MIGTFCEWGSPRGLLLFKRPLLPTRCPHTGTFSLQSSCLPLAFVPLFPFPSPPAFHPRRPRDALFSSSFAPFLLLLFSSFFFFFSFCLLINWDSLFFPLTPGYRISGLKRGPPAVSFKRQNTKSVATDRASLHFSAKNIYNCVFQSDVFPASLFTLFLILGPISYFVLFCFTGLSGVFCERVICSLVS